ncbi:MAG: prepilin-type N-terminal cleavage/methylation domain-containing protein [Planctomycetes bacterium]|nr:prepilin-type N-terminal cleavage/methylation domain-containing protein [Planctomycetota bacterium]
MNRKVRADNAFTLVELLVVIAIITVLAGLLIPALGKALDSARQVTCAHSLKQLGMSVHMYAGDNSGIVIPVSQVNDTRTDLFWHKVLIRDGYNRKDDFYCAAIKRPNYNNSNWLWFISLGCNIRMSGQGSKKKLSHADRPSVKMLLMDSSYPNTSVWPRECVLTGGYFRTEVKDPVPGCGMPAARHFSSCNVLCLDGHVTSEYVPGTLSPQLHSPFNWNNSDDRVRLSW